jgi:hypothetical protein
MPLNEFKAGPSRPIATQVCTLRFHDGQIVTARISARSPHEECAVVYAGAVDRLPLRCERADSVLLRALFQSFARERRAAFAEELIGSWVESAEEPEEEQGPGRDR